MTTSFDSFAVEYNFQMGENGDINHQYSIDPALFELINLEDLAKIQSPRIYDLGCGNGYLSRLFNKKFPNSQIYASDISPKLIKIAKEQEIQNKNTDLNTGISYFVCDGCNFDNFVSENGSFDLVYANMSLHYIENVESLKNGLLKILKSGGKFVFTTGHSFGDLKLFSNKPKNQLTKDQMVQIIQDYYQNKSKSTFFGDFPLTIHKKSISFYINFFLQNGFKLGKMLEIPKVKLIDGQIINTQIPAYYGLSFHGLSFLKN